MVYEQDYSKFRNMLQKKRSQILDYREDLEESRKTTYRKEPELEERGRRELLLHNLEHLDEQRLAVIEKIDRALRKIETGSFGICERCGETISYSRLEAVPWTRWCVRCAENAEKNTQPGGWDPEDLIGENLSSDIEGMNDEDLKRLIWEKLRNDGRVEMEEIEISAGNGIVELKGALPSETKHSILLQILGDIAGIRKIVDFISIDRQLWERPDRTSGKEPEAAEKQNDEILHGEQEKENIQDALAEGKSTIPSDRFVPEKER